MENKKQWDELGGLCSRPCLYQGESRGVGEALWNWVLKSPRNVTSTPLSVGGIFTLWSFS